MNSRVILTATIALLWLCPHAHSQIIAKRDLDLFLGKMAIVLQMPEEQHASVRATLDISHFEFWTLDTIEDGIRWSESIPYEKGFQWMRLDTTNQISISIDWHTRYYFYLMHDIRGYGGGQSILTTWKETGTDTDSVEFVCAQTGFYGGSLSLSKILKATLFPDSSILLVTRNDFADGGDYTFTFSFMRGVDACHFESFFSANCDERSKTNLVYDFTWLQYYFEAIETTVYLVPDKFQPDPYIASWPDSATARVIHVWQLAKEKFDIK